MRQRLRSIGGVYQYKKHGPFLLEHTFHYYISRSTYIWDLSSFHFKLHIFLCFIISNCHYSPTRKLQKYKVSLFYTAWLKSNTHNTQSWTARPNNTVDPSWIYMGKAAASDAMARLYNNGGIYIHSSSNEP